MAKNTDHYAIAVGIDDYASLRRLRSCVRDATRMSEWFTSEDGGNLPESPNVRLITSSGTLPSDPFDAKPIQMEIDRALRDFGAERGDRIGKRLYFYFAGHGFGPTFDDVGMLMANATMESLGANIGLRPYRLFFRNTRLFDEVIFFLDCCRDPAKSVLSTESPQFNGDKTAIGGAANVADFLVLAAAYGAEAFAKATETGAEPRGLLTDALLEGLRGAARAVDAGGRITSASLRQYLQERVKTLAGQAQLQQDPEVLDPNPLIVIRTLNVAALPRIFVHIVIPQDYASGEIILRNGNGDEIGRKPVDQARAANPWVIDLLPNSRYEVQHTASEFGLTFDPGKTGQNPYVVNYPRPAS